jgi:hypothetical protein
VLLGKSDKELQQLLDALWDFCLANALTVNIKKSEVVVFNKKVTDKYTFKYNGHDLEIRDEFIYLGILFQADNDAKAAGEHRFEKGRRARFAVSRRCSEMGIENVRVQYRLFDSLVKPVLSYGSEVWGPGFMTKACCTKLNGVQLSFIKRAMGIRDTTPTACLSSELDVDTISEVLLGNALRFYVKIRARDEDDLVRLALSENIAHEGKWFKRLLSVVKGATGRCGREYMNGADWNDVDVVIQDARKYRMKKLFESANKLAEKKVGVHGITADRQVGYKVFVYLEWFGHFERMEDGTHAIVRAKSFVNRFWYNLNRRDQVRIVAQFRLGVHWLAVETGRFGAYVQRHKRICPLCVNDSGHGTVEDELHIFQCTAYEEIRKQHAYLFENVSVPSDGDDAGFRSLMNPENHVEKFWRVLASFFTQCKRHRINMTAEGHASQQQT